MRIDTEKIKAMCALSDDALWAEIVKIGASHGFKLPTGTPPASDMEQLREAMNGGSRLNLGSALRIIDNYRKQK